MAEKTTTKKTTTKAAAEKAEKKTTSAKAATAEKATEKKTTAAKTTRTAAKKDTARTAEREAPAAAPRPSAITTAGKAVAVRKRTAATVARAKAPAAGETATGWRRFRRKTKVGVVISAKQAKTVIVTVGRMREHPLYKKVIRLRKGFAAHDEAGDVREGDLVRIQESRPYSATKRWKVVEVLSRSGEAGAAAPKIADIERQLAEAEGTDELLQRPDRETEENEEEEAK